MRIGILSDTHDNINAINKAVKFFNSEKVEHVLHAGDIVSPFTIPVFKKLNVNMTAVYGNNDGEKLILKEKIESIGSKIYEESFSLNIKNRNIAIMHKPMFLDALVTSKKYDMVIYGHTHKKEYKVENNTTVLNPGECCGWLTGESTVAICDLNTLECKTIKLN